MVDTRFVVALTHSMEQAEVTSPPLERWLDRAKELQTELSWRIVSLSRYLHELPSSAYAVYADALTSALQDEDLASKKSELKDLTAVIQEFADILEGRGQSDKASSVRSAIESIQGAR
jgi:hypothetical protein